ncbi:hypothetical protein FJQ98_16430 [Lysinibacillus agricola]|uniref:Uncharacterized protein n=1 Tax=Lysinibacillus agricola TaxID=2590012 RepID=A0ABX7ANH2_9BACI|nr:MULTISPECIES: hypothetical protein [Lysinibacillus]KOS61481.1 hypothetical protein AN161_17985 [Lysinibacillus sp. FJAT-14222]QQP10832.1 hypothetical protein FJQ98_16430 [Lysinibacillus agricola]
MIETSPTKEELANEIKVLRGYIHEISEVWHSYHIDGISKKKYINKVNKVLNKYYSNEEIDLDISELTHELFP